MAVDKAGITTGLLGYSVKKEFLADALCFVQVETLTYELFSLDMHGLSPTHIYNNLYNDFTSRFSGDVNVKVFEIDAGYAFPSDHRHAARYRASVEIRSAPTILYDSTATGTNFNGVDYVFWGTYGTKFRDFNEEFTFDKNEEGNTVFNHDISFGLISGDKTLAGTIANAILSQDHTANLDILVGGAEALADTGNYLNYFTEVYDTVRQSYRFTKKRERLSLGGFSSYNLNHSLEYKDDGTFDVVEKGNVYAAKDFSNTQAQIMSLINGSYTRCDNFYQVYSAVGTSGASTLPLINTPVRTTKSFNRLGLKADYTITYTNNPTFHEDGTSIDELFELQADELNFVTLRHNLNFTLNKRTSTTTFMNLLNDATGYSPTRVDDYYADAGNLYDASKPLKKIKQDMTWPSRNHNASARFEYSNNPKYFPQINGVDFNYVDIKVQHQLPVDMTNEYKIINRPSKNSVVSYAYQTEQGQYIVTVEGGLGRDPDEFISGFRSNHGPAIVALYKYGISLFMKQFLLVVPAAFTYYLSDIKYTVNQDGVLSVILTFTYTLKKYMV